MSNQTNPAGTGAPKQRGFALSAVLALLIFANVSELIPLAQHHEELTQAYPGLTPAKIAAYAFFKVIAVAGALGVWFWKRWGFGLVLVSYGAMLAISITAGARTASVYLTPILLLALFAAVRSKREHFDPAR